MCTPVFYVYYSDMLSSSSSVNPVAATIWSWGIPIAKRFLAIVRMP